jgi:8-oxo-dGTP pyrophosphatase MutT (NUDIX family)
MSEQHHQPATKMMELSMSKAQYLDHINSLPSMTRSLDKLTVGAAIIRCNESTEGPQVQLRQRKLDEPYYPGVYEVPGGKVDNTDATIAAAVRREVEEESNLAVSRIVAALPDMTYTTQKKVTCPNGQEHTAVKHAIQLSYVVQVEDDAQFCWNSKEHWHGMWASRSELE